MKQRKKYFVLNKESDFRKGRCEGVSVQDGGLTLGQGQRKGVYYSRVFDSGEKQMIWHRLRLTGVLEEDQRLRVTVYASESRIILSGTDCCTVEELLKNKKLSVEQLQERMSPYAKADFYDCQDMILHQAAGRFLWFRMEMMEGSRQIPVIQGIKIEFPKNTWLKYLPEIYEEDQESASFLGRYLGIFQSVYEDMTDQIDAVPLRLNPKSAGTIELHAMAQWLGVEKPELWQEWQLRLLTAHSMQMHQYRGTVWLLKKMLKLYTGKPSYVVEYCQLEPYFDSGPSEEELKRLYGSNPYEFTVLLQIEGADGSGQKNVLKQIIDMVKPASMECRIVVLKPYIFLGQYTYLGINSVLGRYKEMELNGLCALPFTTIGGAKEGQD